MMQISRLVVLQLEDCFWISGNLININTNKTSNNIFNHLIKTLKSYLSSGVSNEEIKLQLDESVFNLTTDSKGHFSKTINVPHFNNPTFKYNEATLDYTSEYPQVFKNPETNIEVISDIDDTVLVSHTASAIKRIRNILFLIPKKRKTILYTYKLMQAFKELDWRVTYLSKSESNLFPLISDFIDYHDLPKGALLLSPHLKWNQLAKPNKGRDYKLKHLRLMISNLPQKKFILLGDDTQRDMEIYTQVVEEFESQISMVFIRQTTEERNQKQKAMWKALQNSGVDATYFDDATEAKIAIEKIKQL